MNKRLVVFAVAIFSTISLFAQNNKDVTISGTVSNLPRDIKIARLVEFSSEPKVIDSANIDDKGVLTIKTNKIKSPNFYKLQFDEKNAIVLILSPGENVVFSSDATDLMNKMKLKGSKESELVFSMQTQLAGYQSQLDSLEAVYKKTVTATTPDSITSNLIKVYDVIEKKRDGEIINFVKTHKENLATLFFIQKINIDDNFALLSEIDKTLNSKYPDIVFVSEFHRKIETAARIAIGAEAPNITLADPNGSLISLSSFRGKYVMIDFWASWCSPCRKENPNVVKLYAKYKEKGFEVFSVSLDRSKDAWVNAIKADNLTWTHVSDLKQWQSQARLDYGVDGIPFTVLLNKEGKIIAKGLRGEDLNKKLAELMGQ